MSDNDADIEALKVNKIPTPAKAHDQASRVFLPTFFPPMPTTSEADVSEAYGGSGVKSETPIDTAAVRDAVIEALKTVYDPEIPVNIYELGLIYGVTVEPDGDVKIDMTLTAPACPVAGMLVKEVADKAGTVPGVATSHVSLVWDPPWTKDRMSEDALFELGLL
jgi:FeS assembly SUF system protein